MIKEIESLNKEIKRLMTEKTKRDAQKEMLKNNLQQASKEYKEKYGVDLQGENFEEFKEKLLQEKAKVEAKAKEEYELASKLVELINANDIVGAWKVLGVDLKEEEKQVDSSEVSVNNQEQVIEDSEDNEFLGEEEFDSETGDIEDTEFLGEEEVNNGVEETSKSQGGNPPQFIIDDEDDDDFIVQPIDKDEFIIQSTEEDSSDSFGGFGSILSGSKFKL